MSTFTYENLPLIIDGLKICKGYIASPRKKDGYRGLCAAAFQAYREGFITSEISHVIKEIAKISLGDGGIYLHDWLRLANPTVDNAYLWDNEAMFRHRWINKMIADYTEMHKLYMEAQK